MLKRAQPGFTLIELLIGIAIFGLLMALGLPAFTTFLQNTQIKNAAETTLSGISLARAEALRRNATVRFQFVSSLTDTCTLSSTSLVWVVSLADPTSLCATAPAGQADTAAPTITDPKIVQKRSGLEGAKNVTITAFQADGATAATSLLFTGLGRMSGTGIAQINFNNTTATCEAAGGPLRCLRVMVSTGGAAKLCDPKVTLNTDPRHCS